MHALKKKSTVNRTSIATVSHETRNRVAEYRDQNNYGNYDEALNGLLDEAGV